MAFLSFPSPTQLRNLTDPESSQDAATKAYVDASLSTGGNIVAGTVNANVVTSNTVTTSNVTSDIVTANTINVSGNVISTNADLGNLVVANYFSGDGSLLTNLTAGNIVGTVPTSNYAAYAGNITLSAQANITSVGTLSALTVDGIVTFGEVSNIKIAGGTANYVLSTDGTGNLRWTQPATAGSTATLTADVDSFVGTGEQSDFILVNTPMGENFTIVAVQGIVQPKSSYTLSGNTLTFSSAPPSTAIIEVTTFGGNVNAGGGVSANAVYANTAGVAYTVAGANVTGAVANATYADVSGISNSVAGANVTGYVALAVHANITDVANSVSGANVSGYVANATHSNISDVANLVAGANVTGQVAYAAIANSVAGANVSGTVALAVHANIADVANSVSGSNVTGTVALAVHANVADLANSVSGSNVNGPVSFSTTANSVAGANVTGQVANALVAGTVTSSTQSNITSVGTLTSLISNGTVNFSNTSNVTLGNISNVHISGGTSGQVLTTDGAGQLSWQTATGGASTAPDILHPFLFL